MDLRSDIAAAATSGMISDYDVSRELAQLGAYLRDGETVHRLASGVYGAGSGLLAVTNNRVLFLRDGRSGQASEGFPFDALTSATWKPDGARAAITISDSHSTAMLRQTSVANAQAVVDLIWGLAGVANQRHRDAEYDRGYESSFNPVESPSLGLHAAGPGQGAPIGRAASLGDLASSTGASRVLHSEPRSGLPSGPGYGDEAPSRSRHGSHSAPEPAAATYGDGFLPGGLAAGGASGPMHRVGEDPGYQLPEHTAVLPNIAQQRGWGPVNGVPEPAGYNTARTSNPGAGPAGATAGTLAGSVPISVLNETRAPSEATRVPEPYRSPEHSAGTESTWAGEVPISQLAAEDTGDALVTDLAAGPRETSVATLSAPELTRFDGPSLGNQSLGGQSLGGQSLGGQSLGGQSLGGQSLGGQSLGSGAVPAQGGAAVRTGQGRAVAERDDELAETSLHPPLDDADLDGEDHPEGSSRPKPIEWRSPNVRPMRGPKSRASHSESATRPATAPAGAGPSGGARTQRSKWLWLGAGASALVALAAIGSVKLITSSGDSAAPVSPSPAASVATPLGPVVNVAKVLGPDRVEVAGSVSGTVVVLGIVTPSGTTCGADDAKKYAEQTLANQNVTLTTDPSEPLTDRAGHRLAYLQLPNKSDYSTSAVAAGMAKYFDGGTPLEKGPEIKAAQITAKQGKAGLWASPCSGKFAGSGANADTTSTTGSSSGTSTTSGTSSGTGTGTSSGTSSADGTSSGSSSTRSSGTGSSTSGSSRGTGSSSSTGSSSRTGSSHTGSTTSGTSGSRSSGDSSDDGVDGN
jgi:hypothetical protein